MTDKNNIYKRIKIAGILTFIPFVLAAGPLAGHVVGQLLQKYFSMSVLADYVCISIGFIASIAETVGLIKKVTKAEGGLQGGK